jgi:hypothetical protein
MAKKKAKKTASRKKARKAPKRKKKMAGCGTC